MSSKSDAITPELSSATRIETNQLARAVAVPRANLSANFIPELSKTDTRIAQYISHRHRKVRNVFRSLFMRPGMKIFLNIQVEGEENVAGITGPYIVVANHTSHLDAPILFSALPAHMSRDLATGAAADYFYQKKHVSFFTSLFFNTYPVDRRPAAQRNVSVPYAKRAAGMSVSLLQAGIPILIFPEGTRSRSGKIGKFKPGTAALSIKMRCCIVPVAMLGNAQAMPVGANFPKWGRHDIKIIIGKPMRAALGETVEQFNQRVQTRVQTLLELGTEKR